MKVKLVNLGNTSRKNGILYVEENSYVMFSADNDTAMGDRRYKTLAGAMRRAARSMRLAGGVPFIFSQKSKKKT